MKFEKVILKDFRKELDVIEDIVRPMTLFLKKNKNLTGVEIGTYKGKNAKHMLETLDIKKLYLVDPYIPFTTEVESYKLDKDTLKKAKARLKQFTNKEFVIKTSREAINKIPNDLDFVYIDGDHNYEAVKQDIKLWYPKIKNGGVLGGHDCWVNTFETNLQSER